MFDEVVVYKHIYHDYCANIEKFLDDRDDKVYTIPVYNIGVNGLMKLDLLDTTLDVWVLFADI